MKSGQFIGVYQVFEEIGAGGMSTVYRGVDTRSQQIVAIKQLKGELTQPDLLERFKREGEALRDLNHPNIVKMFDALAHEGQQYLIMEYIAGGDLNTLLKNGRLSVKGTLEIALDLADALTRAHRLNIIHRDLKPANVLIATDGTPRLTDFGIAYMQAPERVTKTDTVVGTLYYLSPEAFRGEVVDARTDIWAFGVLLFELLTGQRPFDRSSAAATMTAILTEPPLDLEQLVPNCPIALVDLIYRMLEKEANARIPSVRQVGASLEALLHNLDTTDLNAIRTDARPLIHTSRFETPTPPADAVPHNLPKQPTPFVGREHELQDLANLLNQADVSLVTITAPGGMGKTRLALQAAEQFLQSKFKGIYLVELAPLSSAEHIVPTIADAVGFRFSANGEPRQQLLDYFREKRLLLVMDNFEHMLAGATLVGDILAHAPHIKIIVTSRERLNLRGETVLTIGGMDFPDWETPEDAIAYSAVKLFMQGARRAQPGFELAADDLKYVARICRLVRGMPLGIELAAAWVDMLKLAEIADEIGKSLDFLEADLRDLPERHRSLRAVFDYSWDLLSADERATFARIAVFRGGFSRQAGQAVTGANLKQLTALVNKSLLRRDPESGSYQIHELLREYADEKLEASGEAEDVRAAHSAYYLNALRQRERDLEGGRQVEALNEIESDIENVRAAWLWAARHSEIEQISRALLTIVMYYDLRGKYVEFDALAEQTAILLSQTTDQHEAQRNLLGILLAWRASCTASLFQTEKTKQLIEESKTLLGQSGNAYWRGLLAFTEGYFHLSVGDPADSRPYFEEALAIFEKLNSLWGRINTLLNLGRSFWFRTTAKTMNLDAAQRYLNETLALQKPIGDTCGMAYTLMNLGGVMFMLRQHDEGLRLTEEALALHRQVGNHYGVAGALNNLSDVYALFGQFAKAWQYREEELALRHELGGTVNLVWSLLGFAFLQITQGDFHKALLVQDEALALAESMDNTFWLYTAVRNRGWTYCALGNYPEADACLKRALTLAEDINSVFDISFIHSTLALNNLLSGKFDAALPHLERALQTAQTLDDQFVFAFIHGLWGWLAYEQQRYAEAKERLTQAVTYFRDETAWQGSYQIPVWLVRDFGIRAFITLSDLNRTEGDYASARRCLQNALAVETFSPPQQLTIISGAIYILADEGQPGKAVELAALVQNDSRSYAISKTRATRLLDTLQGVLPAEVFAASAEGGRLLELDTVFQELREMFGVADKTT